MREDAATGPTVLQLSRMRAPLPRQRTLENRRASHHSSGSHIGSCVCIAVQDTEFYFLNHQKTPKMSLFEYFVTIKKDLWYIVKKTFVYLIKFWDILIESLYILIWTACQK
jgi:hypothetical protein